MGQISLPRLNRINGSMFWESSTIFDKNKNYSLKLYIFYRYFVKNFYQYSFFDYLYFWVRKSFYFSTSSIKSYKIRGGNFLFKVESIKDDESMLKNLKVYLYMLNTKYYLFYVYLNLKNYKKDDKNSFTLKTKPLFSKNSIYI